MPERLQVARPSQHWQAGGIIRPIEWVTASAQIRLWNGSVAQVARGDTVLVLWRGLPTVDFVGVVAADGPPEASVHA